MSPVVSKSPRDVESVLLRLPSSIKQQAALMAQTANVSQNAFFATAVLTSMIMLGPVPELGSPENLSALVEAIDGSLEDGFPVIGSFHRRDWENVLPFVEMLVDLDVIGEYRTKSGAPHTHDTVAFTFPIKKVGQALWPTMSQAMKNAFKTAREQEAHTSTRS